MSSPYRGSADDTPFRLGALRSTHAERSGCVLRVIAGALAAFVVAITVIQGVSVAIAIAMVLVIGASIGALWWIGKRNPPGKILLHERGIRSEKHGRPRVILFDDVKWITSGKQRRGLAGLETEHHIVEAGDGTRIAFNLFFDGALDLLAAIDEATRPRLQQQALKAFGAGEIVRFGPIAMSEEGFFDQKRPVVGWSDIERAAIEMPALTPGLVWTEVKIWKRGTTEPIAKYPLEQVPNANVMLAVLSLAIEVASDEKEDD